MSVGRKERADALRNRAAVLAAAARLLDAAEDPGQVSMGDIATAAGVGKGTLFRGFGDRIGLLQALAEQSSERSRADFAAAQPSGGSPVDRATAILHTILQFKVANRSLMLALESAGTGSPYRNPTYDRWHGELAGIVTEVHGPEDAGYLAHALLAAVRSDLIEHLHDQPPAQLRDGITRLVRAVLT